MNMLRDVAGWLDTDTTLPASLCLPVSMAEKGVVEGNLLLVMWENHADPIITGRGRLGYSKIFCPPSTDIRTYGGYHQRRS